MVDLLSLQGDALFAYRRKVQFIFQDPFSSLNPRMTVFDIISEPLIIHGVGDEEERFERVKELMTLVGLDIRFLRRRSEEHTSELQSLMRISYAVFCLQKKKQQHKSY